MRWPSESPTAALVLLGLALAFWPAGDVVARSRLRCLTGSAPRPGQVGRTAGSPGSVRRTADPDPRGGCSTGGRRALLFAGLAGLAVLAMFPSAAGGLAAATTSAGSYVVLRAMSPTDGARSLGGARMAAIRWPGAKGGPGTNADPRLPFAIDLLAVCLRSGMPTSSALRSVSSNLGDSGHPGPGALGRVLGVSAVFGQVAAASELGTEPAAAWEDWIGHPTYGPLARALVVTGESGSTVASRLEDVSQRLRVATGQLAMTRAARAGVALMAPLGLCFLPAFVCLGVLPVVVGIAGLVFG